MNSNRPILEEDLHALVDNRLTRARAEEVQEYLDAHPDAVRRVAAYAEQREQLRAALGPIAGEPIPPELNLRRMIADRHKRRRTPWLAAAAVMLSLGLGGVGGWSMRGASSDVSPGGIAALAREATSSYMVYAADPVRPVELGPDQQAELVSWVSDRIQRPVAVPDLTKSGYHFIGGRVVATEHGPAGMFLYDDGKGSRLAMMMRPMAIEHNTPMVENERGGLAGFTWADQGVGFSLVSTKSPRLHPLANEMRRQIDAKLKS